ncbi:MAG: hypothetical protein AAB441_03125 [Patescibacteria group bacterium]|mgnify:CR=1 FL=1
MEPVSDNSNINSILKIAFVILLLALIGELTYFFYIVPNKKIATKVIPTLAPTLAPTPVSFTPSPIKQEFQGKIVEVNTVKVAITPEVSKEFYLKVERDVKGVKDLFVISFDNNILSKTKVIDSEGKIISYKDLKIDQIIKIISIYDFKADLYKGFEITVLN